MLLVISEERCDIWPSLAHNKVVDVEELGDAGEWGLSLVGGVAGCFPMFECELTPWRGDGEPGNDGTCFIFAEKRIWAVMDCGGRVRCEGSGPDELVTYQQ